jgi:hypothetical protein
LRLLRLVVEEEDEIGKTGEEEAAEGKGENGRPFQKGEECEEEGQFDGENGRKDEIEIHKREGDLAELLQDGAIVEREVVLKVVVVER